ncbi:MAG TPA: hypothetical protein VIV06_06140, partial [Candidatus Limnocylindrales bacterium]
LAGAFGTRRVNDLAGWAGRAPILGVALVLVAVATIGWPGAASWAARGELIRAAMTDPLGVLVTIGGLSSVLYYGRLLAVGFAAPTGLVRASPSWRPTWPAPLPDAPRSADPGADTDGADDDGAATRGAAARARRRPSQTGQPVVLVRLRSASAFGRARETWRLNRAPIAAAIVLALSIIAFGGAAGTLGIADAARAPAPVAPGGLEPFNQEVGPSPAFGPDQSPGG